MTLSIRLVGGPMDDWVYAIPSYQSELRCMQHDSLRDPLGIMPEQNDGTFPPVRMLVYRPMHVGEWTGWDEEGNMLFLFEGEG